MQTATTKRIPYIDAMRGLAMLMVVMGHVMLMGFQHSEHNFLFFLFSSIEVQLFFFVSGMCFRLPRAWHFKSIVQFLGSKAFILCVPASLFLGAYKYPNWGMHFIADSFKGGYWFTYSLFAFMLLYVCLHAVATLCRLRGWRSDAFHVLAALAVYVVSASGSRHYEGLMWTELIGLQQFMHYVYFVLGMLAVKYMRGEYPRLSAKTEKWLLGGVIMVVLAMYVHTWAYDGEGYLLIPILWFLTLRIFSVAVILAAFHRYTSWSEGRLGQVLQYVGRYTLDVYFIHYFLLPRQLTFVGDFFKAHPAPIVECCVTLLLTAAIVAVSLLVGKLIRLSPVTAHWLLGAKYAKREEARQAASATLQ